MNKIKKDFTNYIKKSKYSIIIIILFIIFAYGQRIISSSYSIDVEHYIYDLSNSSANWEWMLALNRWGLVLLNKLLLFNSLPIFASNYLTIITIILYSIAFNYLFYTKISDKYKDRFLKYQFVFPIIFVTSPIFAEQYNFIHQSLSVAIGILLIPISIILIEYTSNINNKYYKFFCYLIAILLAVLSFGIYQSIILLYITAVASNYLLTVIDKRDNEWATLIKYILCFFAEIIVYEIFSKIFSTSNSYLNFAWKSNGLLTCIQTIIICVKSVLKCETIFYNFGYLLSLIVYIIYMVKAIKNKKFKLGAVLAIVAIICAPFYIMIITGTDQLKRTQFNYSYVIGFSLLLGIIYLNKNKYFNYILIFLTLILAYRQSFVTSNLFYTSDTIYKSDYNIANDIVSSIQAQDWYNPQKKYELIFLGRYKNENLNKYQEGEIIGYSYFDFDYKNVWGVAERGNIFLNNLGYKFKIPSAEDFKMAKEYVKTNKTQTWPSKKSITLVDNNKIIIRLSKEM